MAFIADVLLLVAAFAAAFYCRVLAVRLKRLANTDIGLGGAISGLSVQVDEMKSTLKAVSLSADSRAAVLLDLTEKAEKSSRRLELLLASLHEFQDQEDQRQHEKMPASSVLKLSAQDHQGRGARPPKPDQPRSRIVSRNRQSPSSEFVR